MIESIVMLFVTLIKEIVEAGDDVEAQQEALMLAEEKLAHARAKAKFG